MKKPEEWPSKKSFGPLPEEEMENAEGHAGNIL
jgi:hypothetical protein